MFFPSFPIKLLFPNNIIIYKEKSEGLSLRIFFKRFWTLFTRTRFSIIISRLCHVTGHVFDSLWDFRVIIQYTYILYIHRARYLFFGFTYALQIVSCNRTQETIPKLYRTFVFNNVFLHRLHSIILILGHDVQR